MKKVAGALLIALILTALAPFEGRAKTEIFRHVTTEDGLSDLSISCIEKDASGFMLLGSDYTINRFDGVNFKTYHFPNLRTDNESKRVYAIHPADKNGYYVGNHQGLWYFEYGADSLRCITPDLIDAPVRALADDEGLLYAGTDNGLYIIGGSTIISIKPSGKSAGNSDAIYGLAFNTGANELWMTTTNGLYCYGGATESIQFYPIATSGRSNIQPNHLVRMGDSLYIGTHDDGLLLFDIAQRQYAPIACAPEMGRAITDLTIDSRGRLLVATDGHGVSVMDPHTQRIVRSYQHNPNILNGIRSNSVYALYVDSFDDIWVGLNNNGFDYVLYQDTLFSTYNITPDIPSDGMQSRAFLIDGSIRLLGTRNGLYYSDSSRNIYKAYTGARLGSDQILTIVKYDRNYYIGTQGGGISCLDAATLGIKRPAELLNYDEALRYGHINHLCVGPNNELWICTNRGLFRYNAAEKTVSRFDSNNSELPASTVQFMLFDSEGRGWIATSGGLCIYEKKNRSIRKSGIFPSDFFDDMNIRAIYEDNHHDLLFVPHSGSICKCNLGLTEYTTAFIETPKQNSSYMSVIQDADLNYWLTFDDGFVYYKPATRQKEYFTFEDGLPNSRFCSYPLFIDSDSILWLPNVTGLVCARLDRLSGKRHEQDRNQIIITDILLDGQPIHAADMLRLHTTDSLTTQGKNTALTIKFTSLNYTQLGALSYEYKIDEIDDHWIPLYRHIDMINYLNLPVGTYHFHLRKMSCEESEIVKVFTFRRTRLSNGERILLFLGLSVLIIAGLALFFNRKNHRTTSQTPQYKNINLDEKELKLLAQKLETLMREKECYTDCNLKISDLAKMLDCPSHYLSYLFSKSLQCNFSDYVSKFRVEHFKRDIRQNDIHNFTLEALAERSGFNSRVSLFRAFKKNEGRTPTDFIKEYKKEQSD